MSYSAEVLRDSVSPDGSRITTLVIEFPRFILAEMNTHRVFSRNSASSRAIPIKKMLAKAANDPVEPLEWGKNQPGMSARMELAGWRKIFARTIWHAARFAMIASAWALEKVGLHKQIANRLIEVFCFHRIVLTSTEWENFFAQRRAGDAQPEMRRIANLMYDAIAASTPALVSAGEWHLPFISVVESQMFDIEELKRISMARCARVSFDTFDGRRDPEADIGLFDRLMGAWHPSPAEHVATPAEDGKWPQRNFVGWLQMRGELETPSAVTKCIDV